MRRHGLHLAGMGKKPSLRDRIQSWTANLRFPWLVALTGVVFLANVMIPDAIPFVDEILLGLGFALLSRLRKRPAKQGASQTQEI